MRKNGAEFSEPASGVSQLLLTVLHPHNQTPHLLPPKHIHIKNLLNVNKPFLKMRDSISLFIVKI